MARDAFSARHPGVNFLFFALVLVMTAFWMHPVSLAISLATGLAYCARLEGAKVWQTLRFALPVALLAAVINPLFNHAGATILWYFPSGNPLTMESILYGVAAATLLAAMILWLRCCTLVLSSDKFLWLFGRAAPALSLLLSMTLRFVPAFRRRYRLVSQARRKLRKNRLLRAADTLSIAVTWSLEAAIETADSMKCRGYGLPGRTSFSIYRLETVDRVLLGFFALCGGGLIAGWIAGAFAWTWYPLAHGAVFAGFQAAFLLLCLTPVILDAWEVRQWRLSRSEI
ncbi:MAG: energy-coupling factor transporter transmembrane protein EcfT [Oscillospiraceae bacterium]|nr:energy-coupling factor transporter transmembrane protein EcfT [Oscillospiraceae bacterium]